MKRLYIDILQNHLSSYNQMVFISGPRQVGKTTLAKIFLKKLGGLYINWDQPDDRLLFLGPFEKIIERLGPKKLGQNKPVVIFDEIHKYKNWKNHLKGFYDYYKDDVHIIVTGSAKLDIYHKGGDSLMGRYFPYTIHPLSFREILKADALGEGLYHSPYLSKTDDYERLYQYGGFPDPFIQNNSSFSHQWQSSRLNQLFREDVRDLNSVQDIAQFEILAKLLQQQSGQLCNYSSLSKKIRVSDQTIRRWIAILESVYFCFSIRPWSKNVSRSLIKEPKVYLWDWSLVKSEGERFENYVACHLLKYVSFLQETGRGDFDLFYLRDKEKREVDFLLTKDEKPWMMIEAKLSDDRKISPSLNYFQEQLNADYAFQVLHNMNYVNQSCFQGSVPIIVPSRTFLSQLV